LDARRGYLEVAGELGIEAGEEGLLVDAGVGAAYLGALLGGSPAEDLHQGLLVRAPTLKKQKRDEIMTT
jgi:hypothetical protein